MDLPTLAATGIGTLPFQEAETSLDLVARTCPELPFWPQLVRRHPREDMILQAVDGLPLLETDEADHRVLVRAENREEALTRFYQHFLDSDWDYFALPAAAASAWEPFLERARTDASFGPDFLKAQIVGPVTFGLAVRTSEGRTLLEDPELREVVVKGLGAKAAWLAGRIIETGRTPLIFFDEPALTGFGSAFSTLSRDDVVSWLDEAADIARSVGPVRVGVHICGNTDWGVIASTRLDVINFDAFGYLDHFLLYPAQIARFLDQGGWLAWGIVPTLEFTGQEKTGDLAAKLRSGWKQLAGRGLDPDLIRTRSLLTPACGVGGLTEENARAVFNLLAQVREILLV